MKIQGVLHGAEKTEEAEEITILKGLNLLADTIPIIAMTANAFSEDIHNCLNAGMNARIAKPIDMIVLEQTVRRVLGMEAEEK